MIECFDESDETNKPKQLTNGCLTATIICIFLTLGFFVLMYYIYYFTKKIKKLNNDLDACNKSKADFINNYSQKLNLYNNAVKDLESKLNKCSLDNYHYYSNGYL